MFSGDRDDHLLLTTYSAELKKVANNENDVAVYGSLIVI